VLVAELFLQPQHGLSTSIMNMVTDVWLSDVRAFNVGVFIVGCHRFSNYTVLTDRYGGALHSSTTTK
jgi:hypothetical protein